MIRIFRSRESVHKEKFIYDRIREGKKRTLVIVPDQYTLAAEKQTMDCLDTEVLLDIEVTGISRLGARLLEETGDKSKALINRYGRHMLISKILRDSEEELLAFKGFGKKEGFVEAINDFISAAKQHEVSPSALALIASKAQDRPEYGAFSRKLHDLALIFSKYQKSLEDKYTDNEDLMDLYIEAVSKSKIIPKTEIWIYGFDSFTPKNISFILALGKRSPMVNLHLIFDEGVRDEDLFTLTGNMTEGIVKRAKEEGLPSEVINIKEGIKAYGLTDKDIPFIDNKSKGLISLERELFSVGKSKEEDSTGIEIVNCGNLYTEAEGAAAYVLNLLRKENYRYRDIAIICNDQELRVPIIKRVFSEYGIELFDDRKRSAMGSPLSIYVTSLLDIIAFGFRTPDILRLLKTGLLDIEDRDLEELENYGYKYRIKGSMWEKPFTRGLHEQRYMEGLLDEIEGTRKKVVEKIQEVKDILAESVSYRDFAEGLIAHLAEDEALEERIQGIIERQERAGLKDRAEETAQIKDVIIALLSQIGEIMGEAELDSEDFSNLLRAGLTGVEIGVLPPSGDDIVLGTMQRTRTADIKAMLVIGANDELIPRTATEDILFSKEELLALSSEGQDFGLDSNLRLMEENLAIYRNLTKPTEHLRLSYASLNEKGKEIRPSEIIKSIKTIFPDLKEEKDPIINGDVETLIGGSVNTMRRFTEAKRLESRGREISSAWDLVEDWLLEEDEKTLTSVKEALEFKNVQAPLPEDIAMGLYSRFKNNSGEPVFIFSPTALERYSRCPFSYFLSYAVRPEELREDEVGGRDIGDLYHNTIQAFTEEVGNSGKWNELEKSESDEIVERLAVEWARDYRSNLFEKGGNETYRFKRAIKACKYIAWTIVEQAREGKIKESYFEIPFTISNPKDEITLDAIEKDISKGKAYIQGKIDRVDILEDDRVKIIDYKTGNETFNVDEVKAGYRLQLMLYLQAAQEKKRKPAGVFYFLISEPELEILSSNDYDEKTLKEKIDQVYRMEGLMLEDEQVIDEIAGDFQEASNVVKLKKTTKGVLDKRSLKALMKEDDFQELQTAVDELTTQICEDLSSGKIDIAPMESKSGTACDYCAYRAICKFDPVFEGNEYRKEFGNREDGN